jgi:cytochrome oxidase Cu insertion factor (SCO1/SenC/PrrC family)
MTRLRALVPALVVLVLAGSSVAAPRALDDLMMELSIAPFDPQTPPAFTVTTLDGDRLTLADVKGRAVLVYFWATW